MAATNCGLTVIEKCRISPPANTIGQRSLPLTFFDLVWLLLHPVHQLFFYEFPHSKPHFIEKLVPKLKQSLSITLQHFFPFASNLIVFPPDANDHSSTIRKPEIRYVEGDSISFTVAECELDFNHLKGNHPRHCNDFHCLVPKLDGAWKVVDDEFVKIPLFSIQVTILRNSGFTIGITNLHVLCDARSKYDFLMAWTSIAKFCTDELFLASGSNLPFYDRVIKYPDYLDEFYLKLPAIRNLDERYRAPQLVSQTDRVRATFVLTRAQINWLKKWVLVQLPTLEYVSSFVVGCGYVWSCIAKSRVRVEGKKGEYEMERFRCAADWRARLDPPISQNYFGNCVASCVASTKTTLLTGNNGFPKAVELLGKAISETLIKNKQDMFKNTETKLKNLFQQVPTISVAGTPKLNCYNVDFGWGKPKKYETISLDYDNSISVNAGNESPEDLEFGLCLDANQMDAFISISRDELESLHLEQE